MRNAGCHGRSRRLAILGEITIKRWRFVFTFFFGDQRDHVLPNALLCPYERTSQSHPYLARRTIGSNPIARPKAQGCTARGGWYLAAWAVSRNKPDQSDHGNFKVQRRISR